MGREEALNQAAVSSVALQVHCCLVSVKETFHVVVHLSGFYPTVAKYCQAFSYHAMYLSLPLAPWMPLVSQELFVAVGEPSPNEMVLSARRAKIAAEALSLSRLFLSTFPISFCPL